jgi:DNA-binding XRE family transcriptional regulator
LELIIFNVGKSAESWTLSFLMVEKDAESWTLSFLMAEKFGK